MRAVLGYLFLLVRGRVEYYINAARTGNLRYHPEDIYGSGLGGEPIGHIKKPSDDTIVALCDILQKLAKSVKNSSSQQVNDIIFVRMYRFSMVVQRIMFWGEALNYRRAFYDLQIDKLCEGYHIPYEDIING